MGRKTQNLGGLYDKTLSKRREQRKKTHPDEPEKKQRRLKPSTLAKRKQRYLTTGDGAVGMFVRRPRFEKALRLQHMVARSKLGDIVTGTAERPTWLSKRYVDTLRAKMDVFVNKLFEFAAAFAKQRSSNKKGGTMLMLTDVQVALYWYRKMRREG